MIETELRPILSHCVILDSRLRYQNETKLGFHLWQAIIIRRTPVGELALREKPISVRNDFCLIRNHTTRHSRTSALYEKLTQREKDSDVSIIPGASSGLFRNRAKQPPRVVTKLFPGLALRAKVVQKPVSIRHRRCFLKRFLL